VRPRDSSASSGDSALINDGVCVSDDNGVNDVEGEEEEDRSADKEGIDGNSEVVGRVNDGVRDGVGRF
jgi:hypothetical protein